MSKKMRTILAAVDQSHHAHDVMSRAAELAVLLRNDLVVLSVISSDPMKQFNIVEEQNRFASLHRELIFKHFPRIASRSNHTVERAESTSTVLPE